MSIGKRLEEERKSKGYKSQNALADALGISYPTISRWENDTTTIPSDKCALMSELGLDILYILTGKPATSPVSKNSAYKKQYVDDFKKEKTGDVAGFSLQSVSDDDKTTYASGLPHINPPKSWPEGIDPDDFAMIPLYDIEVSAGHGALAGFGQLKTYLAFTRYSLRKEGLQEAHLACVMVKGDSMEPTLHPRDALMIDDLQREPDGGIFVLRVDESLYIKRLMREKDGIRVISDNQIYREWMLTPKDDYEIIGKKVWQGRWG
ncbi:MAG: XRE family transcriptional regulator [Cardiobacteriaceae bacterium]|nr:XRE family transcriptional regulator [Cardiobacteriaceae bacterium]